MIKSKLVDAIQRHLDQTGESQSALAKRAGLGRSAVREILAGRSRSPRGSTIAALAKAIKAQPQDLLDDDPREQSGPEGMSDAPALYYTHLGQDETGFQEFIVDVPILGDNSHSLDLLKSGDIEYDLEIGGRRLGALPRPHGFQGLDELFAVRMHSNSMYPWRRIGELIYATIELPAKINGHIILQLRDDGPLVRPCIVRQLLDRNRERFIVRRYYPKHAEETIPMEKIHWVYRVFEWEDILLGQL